MFSLFEEDVQDKWLAHCLNKFKRCFTDDVTLAEALNARESIVHEDATRKGGIRSDEIDAAFESIDGSTSGEYRVADVGRHGTFLKSCIGETLYSKLCLTDADVLLYEAALFYSVSDDAYALSFHQDTPLQKYVVYLEPNAHDGTLGYRIYDGVEVHTGFIHEDALELAGVFIDYSLPPRDFETQLRLGLPKFLDIISKQSPHHVNPEIAHGFAQHYLHAMTQAIEAKDVQNLEKIQDEKRAFIANAQNKITGVIYEKLYEHMLRVLGGILDDPNISEVLKVEVREAIDQALPPTDGYKHAVLQCIAIRDAVEKYRGRPIEVYHRVKENVVLKVQERGLPEALQLQCEAVLAQVEEAEKTQVLSLIAPELIKMLRGIDVAIQTKTEDARVRIERRLESLMALLEHPLVSDDYKDLIQGIIQDDNRVLSLEGAQAVFDKLETLIADITFSMLEVKLIYQEARQALITHMMEAESPNERCQHVFNENLITDDELDNMPLQDLQAKTQALKGAADLQRGINLKEKYGSDEHKTLDDETHRHEGPRVGGKRR